MSLAEDLAGFSREKLIELVGRLFGHIQLLEARIAELEGQQKPPTDAGKEPKAPSWVKANRPAGNEPEDQRRYPFGTGPETKKTFGLLVRHLASSRTQPLPSPKLHPLQDPVSPQCEQLRNDLALASPQ